LGSGDLQKKEEHTGIFFPFVLYLFVATVTAVVLWRVGWCISSLFPYSHSHSVSKMTENHVDVEVDVCTGPSPLTTLHSRDHPWIDNTHKI
jgi:hypothetical protein